MMIQETVDGQAVGCGSVSYPEHARHWSWQFSHGLNRLAFARAMTTAAPLVDENPQSRTTAAAIQHSLLLHNNSFCIERERERFSSLFVDSHIMSAEEAATAADPPKEADATNGTSGRSNRPRREEQPPVEELYDLSQPIPRVSKYIV